MERAARYAMGAALLVILVCMTVLASEGVRYVFTHKWG